MASMLSRAGCVFPAGSRRQDLNVVSSCGQAEGLSLQSLSLRHSQLSHRQLMQTAGWRHPRRLLAYRNSVKLSPEDRAKRKASAPNGVSESLGHPSGSDSRSHHSSASSQKVAEQDGWHAQVEGEKLAQDEVVSNKAALSGSLIAAAVVVGTVAAVGGGAFVFKDQISESVHFFEGVIQGLGPLGYVFFVLGYAFLEMLAIPAIPLTMSAGLVFGVVTGTALVSIAGTIAATGAFLIARYAARERILGLAQSNKKFLAIDRAIGEDSFRVVLLLRLSPLLPFSLGNYIYGITSVKLLPYMLASWLGMLPGTWAYVSAGSFGRSLLEAEEGHVLQGSSSQLLSLALGLLVTLGAGAYVTNVAKGAIKDIDD